MLADPGVVVPATTAVPPVRLTSSTVLLQRISTRPALDFGISASSRASFGSALSQMLSAYSPNAMHLQPLRLKSGSEVQAELGVSFESDGRVAVMLGRGLPRFPGRLLEGGLLLPSGQRWLEAVRRAGR